MSMNRDETQRLRPALSELSTWAKDAQEITTHRAQVQTDADRATAEVTAQIVDLKLHGERHWSVLPVRQSDSRRLGVLARRVELSPITRETAGALQRLVDEVPTALRDVKALFGLRRVVSGGHAREAGDHAGRYLTDFYSWGRAVGIQALLSGADDRSRHFDPVDTAAVLSGAVGLAPQLAKIGVPHLLSATVTVALPWAIKIIQDALGKEMTLRQQIGDAGIELRRADTRRVIAEMPIERLKDATRERIRITPLTDAGFRTVQDIFTHATRLSSLPGIGATTAHRIRGAAQTLFQATYDEVPIRIDIDSPTPHTFQLVRLLGTWDGTRKTKNAAADIARAEALTPLANALDSHVLHLVVISALSDDGAFVEAVDAVVSRARAISGSTAAGGPQDPWQDFLDRPADYYAMLQELGFLTEDEDAVVGGLPEEVIAAVRECDLETGQLVVSLRGYQSFAARFALVQRKVIIGDEMGLGKTIEALAVVAHLHRKGSSHALVISPAAVVTNWLREVEAKSTLRAHRLHGTGREAALRNWQRLGGVAVTTYESLGWLESHVTALEDLACVILDEAHYIKNPAALRSQRSARIIKRTKRAILLTGTPLENRVEEFRSLVGYIRPDLIVDTSDLRPRLFRQQVAPVYLRRNQEDVLTELPELVEVDEWLPMSPADMVAYRAAVFSRNFQAMRQAAMLGGGSSEKLQRLIAIVEEAESNNRKVIVFSNYRSVLEIVAGAVPGRVFGPLTGSVPPAKRQALVDEFSTATTGAVLVAQIIAGGVGLNIQAASVVVICEPQLKPTTEWQAIARAHRMGQLKTVQVHRLLSEEGVDIRVTQILARKKEVFADFAAISETAETVPEAFDVSEAELVKEIVEAERQRLFSDHPADEPIVGIVN